MIVIQANLLRRSRSPSRSIRVMCVDDNPLVAEALQTRLSQEQGFNWVGHLSSATGIESAVERFDPDVVLMDLDMPGDDPFGAIADLASRHPMARVLVLSGHIRRDLLDRAVDAGAWGYVSKNEAVEMLMSSIRQVARGEFVLASHE